MIEDALIRAAEAASYASAYRDKAITLTLSPAGIEIVGTWPGWRYVELVSWHALLQDPEKLVRMVDSMDRELLERWRDDGQPKLRLRDAD